jgi:hypothetical protein
MNGSVISVAVFEMMGGLSLCIFQMNTGQSTVSSN